MNVDFEPRETFFHRVNETRQIRDEVSKLIVGAVLGWLWLYVHPRRERKRKFTCTGLFFTKKVCLCNDLCFSFNFFAFPANEGSVTLRY